MQIRWANIIALALAILALIVAVKARYQIAELLSTVKAIGPGGDPDERTLGILALGLIAISAVGIVRILQNNRRN